MSQLEYVPTEYDLKVLAKAHLMKYIDFELAIDLYAISYGSSDQRFVYHCFEQFNKIVEVLGEEKRREIIDEVEFDMRIERKDDWEVFKFTCKEGFFSKPVDVNAIRRIADSIPKDKWLEVPYQKSSRYVHAIQKALGLPENGECPACMVSKGEPHIERCDLIKCTSCGNEHGMCNCTDHDPKKAIWDGKE